MEQEQRFIYLEDGQTEPRISAWQARLSDSPEAVLSVLFDAVEKTSTQAIDSAWGLILKDLQVEWNQLFDEVVLLSERIPIPRGFFVGESERGQAFRQVCHLLTLLEKRVQNLRILSMRTDAISAALITQKHAVIYAELLLGEMERAATKNGAEDIRRETETLAEKTTENAVHAQKMKEDVEAVGQKLAVFCGRVVPEFCERMRVAADMEQEGSSCNPASMASLCGELRAVMEDVRL